ncbi:hypothetical protein BLNAU_16872 [Blattamonas nauphoetae]|uniref:Poly(A) RNA polymerase mitochondrial-like central palm domain-containing protein n=1 Tax=Blattamonas nauphoetae TaxID=2049346 RepID=A0ABQ9X831_9EUKA|nr:hypothetical protein BLNAU_16872 [Blattamonas nauphoetae]
MQSLIASHTQDLPDNRTSHSPQISSPQSSHQSNPIHQSTTSTEMEQEQSLQTIKHMNMPALRLVCPDRYEAEVETLIHQPEFVFNNANYTKIEKIRSMFETFVKGCVPEVSDVGLFGSARSTLMTSESDLDFSIQLSDRTRQDVDVLADIKKEMKKGGPFQLSHLIPSERIPLLKCTTTLQIWDEEDEKRIQSESPTHFDVVIGNRHSILSCDLVRTYCAFDDRVRPFLLLVKKWAKSQKIAQATSSGLSSYTWNLACLCFLQMCNPPVIPNIQSPSYIASSDRKCLVDVELTDCHPCFSTDEGPWKELRPGLLPNPHDPLQTANPRPQNTQSVGSLFVGFVDFMGNHYKNEMALSVQHGGLVEAESIRHLMKAYKRAPRILILDPFYNVRNIAGSVQASRQIMYPIRDTIKLIEAQAPFPELISPKT